MRIKFVGIRIHNFLSIADESINLEDMGFTIVTGINNRKTDNASSNGSGKSSIFNAICYALTGETAQGVSNNIENIFAEHEVDQFYINFCDPWPKARHAKRRLTHIGFLQRYGKLLKKPGRLIFKTDNRPLFDFSLEQFAEAGLAVEDVSFDLHSENRPDNIMTEYERKFSGFGEKINRCEVVFA